MTKLADFSLSDLMIFSVSVLAGLSACITITLKTCFKSKCKTIYICCIKCVRDTNAVIEDERLGLATTLSPRAKPMIQPQPEPEP